MISLSKEKNRVLLNEVELVKSFVNCVSKNCEHDVILHKGRYYIDAKSLLGVFSLDLSKPVDIEFLDEADSKKIHEIMPNAFA